MAEKQDMTIEVLGDDTPLDNIENLPSFGCFLTGAYKCTLNLTNKEVNGSPAIEAELILKEIIQLGEEPTMENMPPSPGDKCSTIYRRNNKVAMSNFNLEIAGPVAAKFGAKTIGEVIAKGNGTEITVIVKRDYQKDTDKSYLRIKQLAFT